MATIRPVIAFDDRRSDGTWRVAYRLYHGKILFISTSNYVGMESIDKETKELKESYITHFLSDELKQYRKSISELGNRIRLMSCESLRDHLLNLNEEVDFFKFAESYIQEVVSLKSRSSIVTYKAIVAAIKQYHKQDILTPLEITDFFITRFELFLMHSKDRELSKSTVNIYIQLFKKMFNEMKRKYNNDAIGDIKIPHNPFAGRIRLKRSKPKDKSLDIKTIRRIREIDPKIHKTNKHIGQDCFMLIFMMLGINLKDIYDNILSITPESDRMEYNRSKTQGRRVDEAFISVKIPEEARPYIERIQKFLLRKNYSDYQTFYHAVKTKLVAIGNELGIESLGTYHARHSFSNIAINDLLVDPYHVSLSLNHIDGVLNSTRPYVKPNWSFIDIVQTKVIEYLFEDQKKETKRINNIFSKINLVSLKY